MAWLDFSQPILGRNTLYGVTNGSADLPSSADFLNVGDYVQNLGASGPAFWRVTSTSPLVFEPVAGPSNISSVAGAGTLSPANSLVLVTVASTQTLPDPASWPAGQEVTIKGVNAAVTIAPASGTIDGAATKVLASGYNVATVTSDGTNYLIVGN